MRIWRCHKRGLADQYGEVNLLCGKVGNDEKLVVEQIVAVNETTADSEIEIGIKDGQKYWPVAYQLNAVLGDMYFKAVTMRLKEYERVYCNVTGAIGNDVCQLWAYGVVIMRGESYLKPDHFSGR